MAIMFGVLLALFVSCGAWSTPVSFDAAPLIQYYTQDGFGGYQYAYNGPYHAKVEKSLNGITHGGYSYIDANGLLQTVSYTADAKNGFRVHGSNLPQFAKNKLIPVQDTSEVVLTKKRRLDILKQTESQDQQRINNNATSNLSKLLLDNQKYSAKVQEIPKNDFVISMVPQNHKNQIQNNQPDKPLSSGIKPYSSLYQDKQIKLKEEEILLPKLPVSYFDIVKVHQPLIPTSYILQSNPYQFVHNSHRHTQDSLGRYQYSYVGDTSAKTEFRSLDGTTRGAYSYIDAHGDLQQVYYIADQDGFRVSATNLPEAT